MTLPSHAHAHQSLNRSTDHLHVLAAVWPRAEDEFAGFVRLGGPATSRGWALPGPLPRYGEVAGVPYTLAALPAKQVCVRGG